MSSYDRGPRLAARLTDTTPSPSCARCPPYRGYLERASLARERTGRHARSPTCRGRDSTSRAPRDAREGRRGTHPPTTCGKLVGPFGLLPAKSERERLGSAPAVRHDAAGRLWTLEAIVAAGSVPSALSQPETAVISCRGLANDCSGWQRLALWELHPKSGFRKCLWVYEFTDFAPLAGSASAARPRHGSAQPGSG
jgi:hypothetical protein